MLSHSELGLSIEASRAKPSSYLARRSPSSRMTQRLRIWAALRMRSTPFLVRDSRGGTIIPQRWERLLTLSVSGTLQVTHERTAFQRQTLLKALVGSGERWYPKPDFTAPADDFMPSVVNLSVTLYLCTKTSKRFPPSCWPWFWANLAKSSRRICTFSLSLCCAAYSQNLSWNLCFF